MIFEFIGLPASGKSSLAKELEINAQKNGKIAVYPLDKLYKKSWLSRNLMKPILIVGYFIKNSKKSLKLIRLIMDSKQEKLGDVMRLCINNLFLLRMYNKYYDSKKIVIFDEGVLHHFWAINIGSKNKISLSNYLAIFDSIFTDVIVIYVNVESAIISERMLSRKEINRRHLKVFNNIENYYKSMETCITNARLSNVVQLTNNNMKDFEKNKNLINSKMSSKFK